MSDPTVVLVHGAFADASGFAGIIRELESAGLTVVAPPNPLRSVASDAATVGAVAGAIDGPVVLVGHSYGGAVISQASAGLENVTALVYLAAFGLDVGESCASVQQPFPPPLLASTNVPTPYPAVGAAQGPDLYVGKERFRETFCADVPVDVADVMLRRSDRSRSPRSPRTRPRPGGRTSRPGSSCPSTTTPYRRTRNGSWPSGWARPPTRSTDRTRRSSPGRCWWPPSSRRRSPANGALR